MFLFRLHLLLQPTGLIDAGESAPDAAIRELKEETGYLGTVQKSSPGKNHFTGSLRK